MSVTPPSRAGSEPRFDPEAPSLVLAPHLAWPTRTGANLAIDRRWRAMSQFLPYVDLVGREAIRRYAEGAVVSERSYANEERSRIEAAARTVLRRSHYLREKFLTPDFVAQAQAHLADSAYGTVLFSYLYTAPLLEQDPSGRADRVYLIETHNDDFKWYRTLREATRNPLSKLTARLSEQATVQLVQAYADQALLLHVTEADHQGYEPLAPGHRFFLNWVGVEIPEAPSPPQPPEDVVRLVFVGSLGVTMNVDALHHFAERFYPALKEGLGAQLAVDIVGSNPAEAVTQLCETHGWALHANVSDERLRDLYASATFSILPFNYATGAKLKLLESLAHGVPFLATTKVEAQIDQVHPLCLLSDEPAGWLGRARAVQADGLTEETRAALVAVAEPHSWTARARVLVEGLQQQFA
ncbi:MAG: glycosyltransferase [Rhodothermaceae bacterium]|nr:glycosyltransferase [Rhodothermaceae bacterium]